MYYNKQLIKTLLDENVQLKTALSELKDKNEYLTDEIYELNIEMSTMKFEYEKEIRNLKLHIEALEDGRELKSAYEYIERLKREIAEDDELLAEYRAKENFTDLQRIHFLESELEDLKSRTEKNPFRAGRKKDYYLEDYVLECIKSGMKPKDIIGSNYVNSCYGEIRTVSQASYYRLKKQFLEEGKIERKIKATDGKRSKN